MQKTYMCAVCEEAIYNVICPNCLLKEFFFWLREQNVSKRAIEDIADELAAILEILRARRGAIDCAICKRTAPYSIDPYCFTKAIFDTLRKTDESLAKKFVKNFSFDFEQTSYSNPKYGF